MKSNLQRNLKNHLVENNKLIGSQWTAAQETLGWFHFHVITIQKKENEWFIELAASCDKEKRIWIPKKELKENAIWKPGWLNSCNAVAQQSTLQNE